MTTQEKLFRKKQILIELAEFLRNVSRGLRQKENPGYFIPLQSMEILSEPPHLLVGQRVEFKR